MKLSFRGAFFSLLLSLVPAVASAQIEGAFNIDLTETPASGSVRVIGMGGAYTALAFGLEGANHNPAGYANRPSWEREWWDFELSFGIQFPGAYQRVDYFLNERSRGNGVDSFSTIELGARLQLASFGFGGDVSVRSFRIRTTPRADADLITRRFGVAYSIGTADLIVGAGLRVGTFNLRTDDTMLVGIDGVQVEFGALYRPAGRRFRIGAAFRSALNAQVAESPGVQLGEFYLPLTARLPWRISVGFAWQWLGRDFNPRYAPPKDVLRSAMRRLQHQWCVRATARAAEERSETVDPRRRCDRSARPVSQRWWQAEEVRRDRERQAVIEQSEVEQEAIDELWDAMYESRERRYILLAADAVILGATPNSIGLDAFVLQEMAQRGEHASLGVHLGLESEVVENHLVLRVGTYFEPARYEGVRGRIHGTFGFDLRLIRLFGTDFKLIAFVDGARRFVNWGVSVGVWH